jgi:hypothetical protein
MSLSVFDCQRVLRSKIAPNNACTGLGVRAAFKQLVALSGFGLSSVLSSRPSVANASRWAAS